MTLTQRLYGRLPQELRRRTYLASWRTVAFVVGVLAVVLFTIGRIAAAAITGGSP